MLNKDEKIELEKLGSRLKTKRLELNHTQKEFAFKIGTTVNTYKKLEGGNEGVKIGFWIKALSIIDKLNEVNKLITSHKSLFKRAEMEEKIKHRQRASRKK